MGLHIAWDGPRIWLELAMMGLIVFFVAKALRQ